MLLYGISMLYGATGHLDFPAIAQAISAGAVGGEASDNRILIFGLVFVIIGIGFKFGAVPFHMWIPDVYQGAPAPVALFLSSAPKVAAFAMAARILLDALPALAQQSSDILIILSVLSMGIGNLVAIAQSNIKRMLGYSTISHVGFIFLGLLAGTQSGYAAAMFYAVVYALMAAGAFGVLVMMSHKGFEAENLDDLKGLGDRDPWLAAMMTLIMFSMAGVPPLVGFMAKLLVLEAIMDIGLVWLALVAVAFSIIGAFYYLRVVKMIYFDKPVLDAPIDGSRDARIAVSLNGLAMLVLGMFPAALLGLCERAFVG
jgi:NADH-quinone oxidoreductase subunit N